MHRILAALILVVVVSACGGSDPNPVAPSPAPVAVSATRLRVGGNAALTTIGDTSQLTAIATFSDATEKDVTAEALWTSTEPSFLTVVSGLLTVRRLGVATISARYLNTNSSVTV